MITIRAARNGKGWEYDIRFRWSDGTKHRERANAPVSSKTAAQRWAENRERELLTRGKHAPEVEGPRTAVPTVAAFWPRVRTDHYVAERKKASTLIAADCNYKNWIGPQFGKRTLDSIDNSDVATLKGKLSERSRKTVNNVLALLSCILTCAENWKVIKVRGCEIKLLKVSNEKHEFYEVDEYRRLLEGAKKVEHAAYLMCLLAGSAGLRRGELEALRWDDLDMKRRIIEVEVNAYRGVEDTPKSGKGRKIPMTDELHEALRRMPRVVGQDRVLGARSAQRLRAWFRLAQKRAGMLVRGGPHLLRHTFCSHLAMAGVAALAIQKLAGHSDLKTTQRYMHLAPGGATDAIGMLGRYTQGASHFEKKVAG